MLGVASDTDLSYGGFRRDGVRAGSLQTAAEVGECDTEALREESDRKIRQLAVLAAADDDWCCLLSFVLLCALVRLSLLSSRSLLRSWSSGLLVNEAKG